MSNRVDFFQSDQMRSAIPAATVSIMLNGVLCPYLELLEIVRDGWPEFSWARLAFNPAGYPQGSMELEEMGTRLSMGKSICVRQVYNNLAPDASACSFPVFVGGIEAIEATNSKDGESFEIIAKDFSARFRRVTIYGQRIKNTDDSIFFLTGAVSIFNESGKPNATNEPIENRGHSYKVFCANNSLAQLWSYADVIYYLLCEYLPKGILQIPEVGQLKAITENQKVYDLDVTGLSLLEALYRCCEDVGIKFRFVPRLVDTGPAEAIEFYKNGYGRTVELNCQHAGKQFNVSKTNIAAIHTQKNLWPVTHKYIGQGDFKVFEATFNLIRAWEPADEEVDYDKFSPSTNPDFYKVKNVFRKWCLNEAGDYSGDPYNEGDIFDFSEVFDSSSFAHRHRRFWPTLTADKQGKSLGYFLQVSYDGGVHWWQYLHAFDNLLDECGIWLSSDRLDFNTWVAALKGVLKFRITASVVSDERLSCEVTDGPVGSVVPVVEHVITLARRFKYRKVSDKSIFADTSDGLLGVANEVDDTSALYEFVRKKAHVASEIIETVDVQTLYLAFDYRLGDRITCSPDSRDLLSCRSDNRSIHWIKKAQMDFENQCTNIEIIRQRNLL